MDYKVKTAERIKLLRKCKHLTQIKMAKDLRITPQLVSAYEHQVKTPACRMLIKLADYFDVSIDYLVGRTDK